MIIPLLGIRLKKILREEVGEDIETMESITLLRVLIDPEDIELRIYSAYMRSDYWSGSKD